MADAIKADAEAAVAYALEAPYPPAAEVDAHVFASVTIAVFSRTS